VSGYRNQRKQTSNHFKGTASDIRIAGVAPKKIREFAETLDGGGMGIGIYPRSGFVHIDVRGTRARWVRGVYRARSHRTASSRKPATKSSKSSVAAKPAAKPAAKLTANHDVAYRPIQ
jgi:hypothetical protein